MGQMTLYIKYFQTVKINFLTTDFKTKISLVKVKIHVYKISCQNFSLIQQLTEQESSFYQEDVVLKTG